MLNIALPARIYRYDGDWQAEDGTLPSNFPGERPIEVMKFGARVKIQPIGGQEVRHVTYYISQPRSKAQCPDELEYSAR